jgi:16S rRNA (adenine1518-N6/adenine1519-N6)-dimethyltransferase
MQPPAFPADHPRRLLAELKVSPSRRRGQNFLHDRNVARSIVAAAREMGPPYLEIGPGLGALTALLAAGEQKTVAVEIDRRLAGYLRGLFAGSTVEVVEGDFLRTPEDEWRRRFPAGGTVVGNLPYSLSSPIVLRLMELREVFPRALIMLQKEVAERLCAPHGGKEYGTLTVYLSVLADARLERLVRRTCFTPAPGVDSAVVSIRFRSGIPDPLLRNLQAVVRSAFARRRKKLRNAPVPFLPGGMEMWCDLLSRAGIDPSARAESVPPERYLLLASTIPSGEGRHRGSDEEM